MGRRNDKILNKWHGPQQRRIEFPLPQDVRPGMAHVMVIILTQETIAFTCLNFETDD